MSACKWMADMLLAMFTVYLFFLYFGMFFERRKKNNPCIAWSYRACTLAGRNPGGYQ